MVFDFFHTGLRPLSPHGEGYCRVCHFVVGLDRQGLLVEHTRSASHWRDERSPCEGGGRRPPKATPYASRKAAFRVTSPDRWCPECRQWVKSTLEGGVRVYARHGLPLGYGQSVPVMCMGTARAVAKDHSGERG